MRTELQQRLLQGMNVMKDATSKIYSQFINQGWVRVEGVVVIVVRRGTWNNQVQKSLEFWQYACQTILVCSKSLNEVMNSIRKIDDGFPVV